MYMYIYVALSVDMYMSLAVCRIKCFIAMKMGKLLPVFAAVFAASATVSAHASATASTPSPASVTVSVLYASCLPRLPSSTSRRLKLDLNGFQAVK